MDKCKETPLPSPLFWPLRAWLQGNWPFKSNWIVSHWNLFLCNANTQNTQSTQNTQNTFKLKQEQLQAVLPESLNKKLPNFLQPQKTYIKAILKSQKTYNNVLPEVKNNYIKALKSLLKTGLNKFFHNFWKVAQKGAKF